MTEVYKFGGTCNNSRKNLNQVCDIIDSADKPLVVTLSAAAGVTNQLDEMLSANLTEEYIQNSIDNLKEQHENLLPQDATLSDKINKILDRLQRLLIGIMYTEELTERTKDLVMTFGERLIVEVVQEYLENRKINSTCAEPEKVIFTDGTFGQAMVLLDESVNHGRKYLTKLLDKKEVILVPGFYGVSNDGEVTTLGRSGTDYTATVLAYLIDANGVTIWKDVHGFMSADPTLVSDAFTIPYLSYAEAAELAFFGAKLLHPRAASPARFKEIPIYIRHIEHLDSITCINGDSSKSKQVIKSVSHMNNLAVVKVHAAVGGNTKGVLTAISDKITQSGGNTISVATSQTAIAFLMKENEAYESKKAIEELGPAIIDFVELKNGTSLLCVVGEGLGNTPGIASQVFKAVASNEINVEMISAGASKTAYHFTVDESDLETSLNAIHDYFFEDET